MPKKINKAAEQKVIKKATDDFHLARSKALNNYANLEMYMGMFFEFLTGTKSHSGLIAFSAVVNTRSRNVMLGELVTLKFGNDYKKFFSSFSNNVQTIDTIRHKLAHWMIWNSTKGGEPFDKEKGIFLARHTNIFKKERIFLDQVIEFGQKAGFLADLTFNFDNFLALGDDWTGDPDKTPWSEIFQQPVTYPPPSGHQLDRYSKEL